MCSKPPSKCFRCGKEGHWAAGCPKKSMGFSQPYPSRVSATGAAGNGSGEPNFSGVICRCGSGVCEPRVAKTDGKVYYRCPAESWKRSNFFMWQDKLKSDIVKQLQYPICSCGAGVEYPRDKGLVPFDGGWMSRYLPQRAWK